MVMMTIMIVFVADRGGDGDNKNTDVCHFNHDDGDDAGKKFILITCNKASNNILLMTGSGSLCFSSPRYWRSGGSFSISSSSNSSGPASGNRRCGRTSTDSLKSHSCDSGDY